MSGDFRDAKIDQEFIDAAKGRLLIVLENLYEWKQKAAKSQTTAKNRQANGNKDDQIEDMPEFLDYLLSEYFSVVRFETFETVETEAILTWAPIYLQRLQIELESKPNINSKEVPSIKMLLLIALLLANKNAVDLSIYNAELIEEFELQEINQAELWFAKVIDYDLTGVQFGKSIIQKLDPQDANELRKAFGLEKNEIPSALTVKFLSILYAEYVYDKLQDSIAPDETFAQYFKSLHEGLDLGNTDSEPEPEGGSRQTASPSTIASSQHATTATASRETSSKYSDAQSSNHDDTFKQSAAPEHSPKPPSPSAEFARKYKYMPILKMSKFLRHCFGIYSPKSNKKLH